MPWEDPEDGDYIRSGHKDPGDTCRTIDIDKEAGIKAIYCKYADGWAIQSYLFDKRDPHNWTMSKAKKWFKDNAEATTKAFERVLNRHPDFQRIFDEFQKYYCKDKAPCDEGEKQYYDWLKLLDLDETKRYGECIEAFRWAKDMITLTKEDEDHKYYKILVAFPLTSMNGNVYTEDELNQAAKTLIGKVPNINHIKDYKLIDPDNPKIKAEGVGAKYEDGAVELLAKIHKQLKCPDCNKGYTICQLIDDKKIVNVSLEANCKTGHGDDGCRGMEFVTWAFLTADDIQGSPHTKTLPGIPLARVFPLEGIMSEAVKTLKTGKAPQKKRLEVQIILEPTKATPSKECGPEYMWDETQKKCIPILPDAKGQCPEGFMFSSIEGRCIKTTTCPEGYMWSEAAYGCVPIPKANPEGTTVVMGTGLDDTSKKPLEKKTPVEKAEEDLGNSELLLRSVRAETKAKSLEEQIAILENHLAGKIKEVETQKGELKGVKAERDRVLGLEKEHEEQYQERMRELNQRIIDKDEFLKKRTEDFEKQIQNRSSEYEKNITSRSTDYEKRIVSLESKLNEAIESRDTWKERAENAQTILEDMTKKYQDSLDKNLDFTKKLTTANEEIMKITTENNDLQEKLRKAKRQAKFIATI